jgi:hypothetical protein
VDDGTSAGLEEDDMSNSKGNDWVATITGGIIVGVLVSVVNAWFSHDSTRNDTLVEVRTKVEYLTTSVNKLTEQPYVRRDEFAAGVSTIENRLTGLDGRVNQLEQRNDSAGRKRP